MQSKYRIGEPRGVEAEQFEYDNIEHQVDGLTDPGTADELAIATADTGVEVEERLAFVPEYRPKPNGFPCIVELLHGRYSVASRFFKVGEDLSGAAPVDCEDDSGLDVLPSGYLLH